MASFIGMTVKAIKFDERKVLDPYHRQRRRWLFQKAALIRQIARRSMKKRSGVSQAGEPPSVHKGGLKGGLRFAVETDRPFATPRSSRI